MTQPNEPALTAAYLADAARGRDLYAELAVKLGEVYDLRTLLEKVRDFRAGERGDGACQWCGARGGISDHREGCPGPEVEAVLR